MPTDNMTATGNPTNPRRPGTSPRGYGEESPEALRRRADVLLDEMMLGAVDMAAGGPVAGHANGATWTPEEHAAGNGAAHWDYADTDYTGADYNGADYAGADHANDAPYTGAGASTRGGNGYYGGYDPAPAAHDPSPSSSPAAPVGGEPLFDPTPVRPPGSHLISAEERYAQVPGAQTAPAAPPSSPTPGVPAPPAAEAPGLPPAADYPSVTTSSAVRRTSATLASTMTVGMRGANRSNLLPRETDVDAKSAQQEINGLRTAIATSLPPGHESVERSRHLLNKAENLLQTDPTRSAEVDYYLSQVRRIVQRSQQTQQWSELYRSRLTLYLWGWLLLAGVMLAALAFYAAPLAEWATSWFGIAEPLLAQQLPLLAAGAFAGTLGASLSALFNVQRHRRQEFGYFDRKYGLRGLLLPLLGFFFGLLLALACAVAYYFLGIDPTTQTWALAAPALGAFLVGFAQEWLYGAR